MRASTSEQVVTTRRDWVSEAIRRIEADYNRSADTHLVPLDLPGYPEITVYLKDESSHPTGSLKHRLARSLFLYALANDWLAEGRPVIEASSGSTAVSEAYFARLLGLPFLAVMPRGTSPEKVAAIEHYGGQCHFVDDPAALHAECEQLARASGGHFMDQFTYAERATDWRANNNIAESIFKQMRYEQQPEPAWIVCSAGTGGTGATLGRYVRYCRSATRILCVDPENSIFFDHFRHCRTGEGASATGSPVGSRIEGIGRPRAEASFLPGSYDAMLKVPDALSLAAMRWVAGRMGRRVGGSTGTNFVGVLWLAARMRAAGERGSIVSILCDGGERYAHSYYNPEWYVGQGIGIDGPDATIAAAVQGDALPALDSLVVGP
jgi:cysteine synthase A